MEFRRVPVLLFTLAALSLAKDKPGKLDWNTGTVVSSKLELRIEGNVATDGKVGGAGQVGHERIQLRAADGTTYDAEQWVTPRKLIRAVEGAELVFAVEGKTMIVEMPDGTRKLKILGRSQQAR